MQCSNKVHRRLFFALLYEPRTSLTLKKHHDDEHVASREPALFRDLTHQSRPIVSPCVDFRLSIPGRCANVIACGAPHNDRIGQTPPELPLLRARLGSHAAPLLTRCDPTRNWNGTKCRCRREWRENDGDRAGLKLCRRAGRGRSSDRGDGVQARGCKLTKPGTFWVVCDENSQRTVMRMKNCNVGIESCIHKAAKLAPVSSSVIWIGLAQRGYVPPADRHDVLSD